LVTIIFYKNNNTIIQKKHQN